MMRPVSLRLADEFFLVAHREHNGRPRLSQHAMDLGLAASLLGELMLYRSIRIDEPQLELTVVNPSPVPCPTAHAVLDQLHAEPGIRSISTWLRFFGQSARDRVGERLLRNSVVRKESAGLWRTVTLYPPLDINDGVAPAVRVQGVARRRQGLTAADVLLVGLAGATGLNQYLLQDLEPDSVRYLDDVLAGLPPPLRCLISVTQSTVGAAVLNRRR